MHDLTYAVDVGVGFGVDETGITIASIATDAFGFEGVSGVALEAERNGEGTIAELFDVVVDGLHARFAGERGEWIRLGVEGLSRIGAAEIIVEIAVGGEELFGTCVVGLEVGVGKRPSKRNAAFVVENAEVFGAKAKECCAVDLGLAADEVGLLGVKGLVIFVKPDIFGVVTVVQEDGAGVPIEFFLGEELAALKDENALPRLCKMKGESAPASPGADDDYVVLVGHEVLAKGQVRIGMRAVAPCLRYDKFSWVRWGLHRY
jgi:hypothetical protein